MYSSAIPGLTVFGDWLYLVISGVSLETAANLLAFLNVAMILREKLCQLWRLNWFFKFVTTISISSIMSENRFQQKQTVDDVNFSTIKRSRNLSFYNSTFVSPIHTFSLAWNIIVYTPFQGTNKKKYFNNIIYKWKLPTLAGNKHLSVHFPFHRHCLFHLSYGSNPSEVDIKVVLPVPTQ